MEVVYDKRHIKHNATSLTGGINWNTPNCDFTKFLQKHSFLLRHNFQVKAILSLGQRMESFSKDWPICFKSLNLVKSVSLMKSIVCESGYSWGPPTISHYFGTFLPWFSEFSKVHLRTTIERAKSVIYRLLGRTSKQCQELSKNASWQLENWLCCSMHCCD